MVDETKILRKILFVKRRRLNTDRTHPNWNIPNVMYGVRKKHKCIKKREIAVFYDLIPRQKRARTAETHWYKVLYRRTATPKEVERLGSGNILVDIWYTLCILRRR